MNLTDNQKELLAYLPSDIDKYGLTVNAKLVLGDLICWYNSDVVQQCGYVIHSNNQLRRDCEIKYDNELIKAINLLIFKNLIWRKTGEFNPNRTKKGIASRYIVNAAVLPQHIIDNIIEYRKLNSNPHISIAEQLLNNIKNA